MGDGPPAPPLTSGARLEDDAGGNCAGGQPPGGNTARIEASTVGSAQTYQAQQNVINNNNYWPDAKSAAAPRQDKPFEDPLEPLPRRPDALKNLQVEIPAELARGPETHRVILISSFRQEISVAASYSLIESTSLSSYTAQALVLDN
ncbi:MAG TPA: hypothetical protein VFJ65_12015, partial [Solirubrobacterales bacterium]|nr:hypothetical protein [Solirubrobacterales bacterium]